MTVGELLNVFKQYNIPNNAILVSNSGWECSATNMDGVYYDKTGNTVVFTQEFSKYDEYYNSPNWIKCRKTIKDNCQKRVMCQGCRFYCPYIGCALKQERSKNV